MCLCEGTCAHAGPCLCFIISPNPSLFASSRTPPLSKGRLCSSHLQRGRWKSANSYCCRLHSCCKGLPFRWLVPGPSQPSVVAGCW
ncbi:hypothetical protein GDO81_011097 [Engystomops pustulosus]|uniref:Secreted protein n=1 Tax=Engystomops pustulosus TaxID=76066 RepID=A0AAV7C4Q6_ENGPU|nr:hypothetical protein GDO81_011097 [Engystomops pustulosus]